jgi:DNA-directed RNA polymerase subunit M/transcription elongation factor TFIIS
MSFCPNCEMSLRKETREGRVDHVCKCGYEEVGNDMMRRIAGKNYKSDAELNGNWSVLASDPVTDKIMKDCGTCGLDYISICRIDDKNSTVFEACKCGREITYRSNAATSTS